MSLVGEVGSLDEAEGKVPRNSHGLSEGVHFPCRGKSQHLQRGSSLVSVHTPLCW